MIYYLVNQLMDQNLSRAIKPNHELDCELYVKKWAFFPPKSGDHLFEPKS